MCGWIGAEARELYDLKVWQTAVSSLSRAEKWRSWKSAGAARIVAFNSAWVEQLNLYLPPNKFGGPVYWPALSNRQ